MPATNFTPIQLYRSTTASQVPTSGNLADGELAINTNDEKLYFKNSGGTVKLLASSAGASGDVVGPASATDNAVVRFDGTTGKLVQNSVVTIADSTGDVAGVGALTMGGNLTLSGGTANGVLYLNGSKVATSGSAFTFSGTAFSVGDGSTQSVQTINGGTTGGAVKGQRAGVNQWFVGDTAAALGSGSGLINFVYNNDPFIWSYAGTELMRLTSTGLGIGTSSPSYKLNVSGNGYLFGLNGGGANRVAQTFGNTGGNLDLGIEGSAGGTVFTGGSAYAGVIGTSNATVLQLGTNGTIRATLDTSGNLGLGVTPSAWTSDNKVMQLGSAGSIGGHTSTSLPWLLVNANYYSNSAGNSLFIQAGYAPRYLLRGDNGTHSWWTTNLGAAAGAVIFTQAMTLDASGRLLVGVTSSQGNGSKLQIGGGTQYFGSQSANGLLSSTSYFNTNSSGFEIAKLDVSTGGNIYEGVFQFYTKDSGGTMAERARITSGGYFKASNDGTYISSTGVYHELDQSANQETLVLNSTNASQTFTTLLIQSARNTTNNTYYAIDYYNTGAAAYKFRVADSGNVTNTNGSYGTISDAKMKTDIVDASSQWADIKAIRFRKFKMKDNPSGLLQLGVVAQELEQTSPGLVDEHVDRDAEGNDLGTTTKSVKTSILLMKAAKALQEAMARIETLEAKVSALEGN